MFFYSHLFLTLAKKNNIRIVNNANDFKVYHQFREELINKEFRLSAALKKGAERFLQAVRKLWWTRRLLKIMQLKKDMIKTRTQKPSKFWKYRSESNAIFVSIHIRRGDYAEWLLRNINGYMVSKLFFERAMDWFRKKVSLGVFFFL